MARGADLGARTCMEESSTARTPNPHRYNFLIVIDLFTPLVAEKGDQPLRLQLMAVILDGIVSQKCLPRKTKRSWGDVYRIKLSHVFNRRLFQQNPMMRPHALPTSAAKSCW